jgi:hypothetical protein
MSIILSIVVYLSLAYFAYVTFSNEIIENSNVKVLTFYVKLIVFLAATSVAESITDVIHYFVKYFS